MPVSHAAQIVGLRADSLMIHLEKRGLYERQTGRNRPWTDREVRVCAWTTASRGIRYVTAPTMKLHRRDTGWD